ncbi:MAG: hydroxyacylglutathione hydrolase [Solirubrobacteraceae bacterium]|jgi:glyoxylase-like metal-dependent hydrolase (beta-lactamase superfamily II)|nr:hydroxyacylglutathione hydrolase [Solirubrobacteraceae bacterium]
MLIERTMSDGFLTNTYLVAGGPGGPGFLVDAGGPMEPLFEAAERNDIDVTHLLLTHHHHDHVCALADVTQRYPDVTVLAHPDEALQAEPFEPLEIGGVHVDAVHTPGHTKGMLNFTVEGHVFTGDTLFKRSIGGVRAPGSTSYADIKSSIMDKLMSLDHATEVHPGHTDPTTIGDEWESNAFIRVWRGLDPEGDAQVKVWGEPATLVVWGEDYDGGHKAWVRWPDGRDDIVPGSQVERD